MRNRRGPATVTGQERRRTTRSQPLRRPERASGRRDAGPEARRPASGQPIRSLEERVALMTTRIPVALGALAALGAICASLLISRRGVGDRDREAARADARSGPRPGHDLHRRRRRHRADPPRRRLLRRPRRLGRRVHLRRSRTRSASLATAGRTTKPVRPALAHRPVRLRARHLRRSAASRRRSGEQLLVLQGQSRGGLGRRRPARDQERRRGPVLPRSGGVPEPEPGRARAHRAARAQAGEPFRSRSSSTSA